ncbi:hypothetical protein [Marisediminitalea sp.]|uniref:hypothetical protein n=1 Tax=Marisediminitalea sp. TaxID=2662268 RepID=UPI003512B0AF
MKNIVSIMALTFLLGGCASAPDINLGYYVPKVTSTLTTSATFWCTTDSSKKYTLHQNVSHSLKHKYSEDFENLYFINPDKIEGVFTSSEFSMAYNGSRLGSLTAKSVGEGDKVIDVAIAAVGLFKSNVAAPGATSSDITNACTEIEKYGTKTKLADDTIKLFTTVTNEMTISYKKTGGAANVGHEFDCTKTSVDALCESSDIYKTENSSLDVTLFKDYIKPPKVKIKIGDEPKIIQQYNSKCSDSTVTKYISCLTDENEIVSRQPRKVSISLENDSGNVLLAKVPLAVPQYGKIFTLPIQHGALFGGTTSSITFAEDGTVKEIQYNTTGGTESLGTAVSKASDTLKTSSEERAAELKSEADLLYQKQRLEKCKVSPSTCPVQ